MLRRAEQVLEDYVNLWFEPLSQDREFYNASQSLLVHAVGVLLNAVKQRFNLIEFALHKGALLLRHHIFLYTQVRCGMRCGRLYLACHV